MDPKTNSMPVNLVYISKNEMFVAALICGAIIGTSYQVGRELQRRFVRKHMHAFTK